MPSDTPALQSPPCSTPNSQLTNSTLRTPRVGSKSQRRRRRLTSFHLAKTPGSSDTALAFTPRRKSLAITPRKSLAEDARKDEGKDQGSFQRSSQRRRSKEKRTSSNELMSSHNIRRSSIRRKQHQRERRKSMATRQQLSPEELADLYSSTIKLSQENKINARNTWSLSLLDYIGMLTKAGWAVGKEVQSLPHERDGTQTQEESPHATNFQLAGVTLDAGVKIYCSRVDSVHVNAFKVLGGLSRTSNKASEGASDSAHGSENDEGGNTRKERKRRRRAGAVTLEPNIENITLKKMDSDYVVDPLFHKMSAAFDEGGAKGMLLNNLAVSDRCELVFDSSTPASAIVTEATLDSTEEEINEKSYDASRFLNNISCSCSLTPTFLQYYKGKLNSLLNANEVSSASNAVSADNSLESSSVTTGVRDQDEFDFEYSVGEFQSDETLERLVGPSDVQPSDGHFDENDTTSINEDDSPDTFDSTHRPSTGSKCESSSKAVDLVEAGAKLAPTAYSFFDSSTLSSWAGPLHWRPASIRPRQHSENRLSKKRRPRGRNATLLDFTAEAPPIDFVELFARGKVTTLGKAALDGFKETKVTLPEDLQYRTEMLGQLFIKPSVSVFSRSMRSNNNKSSSQSMGIGEGRENTEGEWYDIQGDAPTDICYDNMEHQDDPGGENETVDMDMDMDMIPVPLQPQKLSIDFARVAKKVDVQQLKVDLWTDLCGETHPFTANHENTNDEPDTDQTGVADKKKDIRFGATKSVQAMVHNISNFVPSEALEDITFPYIFICLLHLANEKNLSIRTIDDCSDIVVSSTSTIK